MHKARVKHLGLFFITNGYISFIYLFVSAMLFTPILLMSQDTINLRSVNIFGLRHTQFANSINLEKADSFVIANSRSKNLGEILMSYGNLNIKSYGYGGMSNVTMRGGNSYQTAVLWNGFNLQDPLNGGVNIATLPGFFMDEIEIHRGGESSLFGSGAMGGSILIGSKAHFNQGQNVEVMLSSGSFSNYQGGFGYSFSGKRWASDVKIYHKQASNDFLFDNFKKKGYPEDIQRNAQINQTALMQKNAFMISPKHLLNLDFWYQQSVNHLPYSMTQTIESESYTATNNGRTALNWAWVNDGFKIKVRSAFLMNTLQYHDLNASLDYLHKSISSISEVEAHIKAFKKQLLMLGINNTFNRGISASLSSDAYQNRTSLFASYKQNINNKLFIKANLRQEFISHKYIPLTYSININYKSNLGFTLYSSIGKTFRLPTFNDLFWNDYAAQGNPNLKPEWGKNGEVGATYALSKKDFSLKIKLNGFASMMNDLIQWTPVAGIWTPQNYEQVATNGLESSIDGKLSLGKYGDINTIISYTYLQSHLLKTNYIYPDDILGKQMIFTPKHKGNMVIRWLIGKSFAEYQQSFVGRIYTSSDNLEWLSPYSLGNISLGHNFNLNKNIFNATFRAFNIWSSVYYVMPNYAMPYINYEFSIGLKLKTK